MSRAKRMFGTYAPDTYEKDGVLYRRCVFCGETKRLLRDFPKNGRNADGTPAYRSDCKTCYNVRRNANKNKKHHSDFIGGQKRRGDTPNFTHQEWKETLIFFGGECAYCGATPRRNQRLTRDHLVAVSRGGTTAQDNIVPACGSCNSSKGADDFRDWFMKQPFFSQERLNRIFKWRTIMRLVGNRQEEI